MRAQFIDNEDLWYKTAILAKEDLESQDLPPGIIKRWVGAIDKAELTAINHGEFLSYSPDRLVIWSQRSGEIHTVTAGDCDCRAFRAFNRPCFHRALWRLIQRYFEHAEKMHEAA